MNANRRRIVQRDITNLFYMENFTQDRNETECIRGFNSEEIYRLFIDDMSGFVYLSLLAVIGTVGNIHALIVYYKKFKTSSVRTIILILSSIDLFACVISIPHDVIDIRYNINVLSVISCGAFMYIDYAVTLSSIALLTLLSVDRCLLIRRPLTYQISVKRIRNLCLLSVFACHIIALPCFIFYSGKECVSKRHGATNCLDTDTTDKKLRFQLFAGFVTLVSMVLLIISAVAYILIAVKLKHQKRKRLFSGRDHATPVYATKSSERFLENVPQTSNRGRSVRLDRSITLTLVFFVVSFISFSSWMTTLAVISSMIFGVDAIQGLGDTFTVILRSHYITNVVNPMVYFIMYPKFRRECKMLYVKRCFNVYRQNT